MMTEVTQVDWEYDEDKLAELLLYLSQRLGDEPAAGSTKLNKLLFFADFIHFRHHGRPITGAEYQRLPYGPAPRRLLPVRQMLLRRGDAELVDETYLGQIQQRLLPRRGADLSRFSEAEIATVEEILGHLAGRTALDLTNLSHRVPGWDLFDENETIPYEIAFLRTGPPGPRVLAHARYLAELHRDQ
jgi:hypothetical protein